jgi:hypothetical protein
MSYIIYSLFAAFFIGIHIFSMKLLSIYPVYFYEILFFSVIVLIVSRFFIYYGMCNTDNPTNVHLIINFSIFIVFLLTITFLKIKSFDIMYFSLGLFFVCIGFYLIQTSYK